MGKKESIKRSTAVPEKKAEKKVRVKRIIKTAPLPRPQVVEVAGEETVEVAGEETKVIDLNKRDVAKAAGYFNRNKKNIAFLIGGALVLGLGFTLVAVWGDNRENLFLTMGIIILIPGGSYLLYRGIKRTDQEVVIVGIDKAPSLVNSLNIYAKKDADTGLMYPEKIVFEWVEEPLGQPQQCLNNSRYYYVHIWDIMKKRLVAFVLPDGQYFSPREFANVIKMSAHKKLFEKRESLLQKLGPWVMLAAFCASIFGMLVTTPV